MSRINFTSTAGDGYALRRAEECTRDYDVVARSIARRRGLAICAGPKPEANGYSVTLGRPLTSGGYEPAETVQFWLGEN